ncbi:MAG TPA: WXG100 family type VII secretion target [Actinomadura sp.]|jgi:WXG100 family type VII secretion target|nr:hypothetical protein [Streptosporangiaceae bacterium]HEV7935092.1 WXG100 family type VII secretion target [Actinomadura sp.]
MATYTVNMAQVDQVVSEMMAVAKKIESTLQELDNGSKQHLSEWESSTRDVYNQAKLKWDQAAADMVQQAGFASSQLGHINENYGTGEQRGTGLWAH